jgi:thiamine kinase-like enzyme
MPEAEDDSWAEAKARAAIAAAGLAADPDGAEIVPVAGLTNLVFRVTTPQRRFWLRLPGAKSATYLDREAEAYNARAAAAAGVTPKIIHTGSDGTMATAFVDGARPLSELGPVSRDSLALIASCFRRLHRHAAPFRGTFDALGSAERYLARHPRTGTTAARMAALVARMRETKAALDEGSPPFAPCHCDPVPENVLVGGGRALLLDWEYSGMADPLWDLAYFAAAAALPPADEDCFLHAYLGRAASDVELARIALHKAEAAGLAAAWALMRAADSSGGSSADFDAYAEASLAEAEARFSAGDIPAMLDLVRRA